MFHIFVECNCSDDIFDGEKAESMDEALCDLAQGERDIKYI